jgi:hypothetical protein
MMRTLKVLGLLVLVWALPARAQDKIELFGTTYTVVKESRAQTYKNGLTVKLPPRDLSLQLASLNFVEGADPSKDRLFVGSNIIADEAVTAHQFYLLTGADANGVFTKDSATLTEYFGGAQNLNRGGRPTGHMWLNDIDTGVGKDRNIAISSYSGDDWWRLFDLDSMNGTLADAGVGEDQKSDQVFGLFQSDDRTFGTGTSYTNYARFPQWDGHTVVVFAQNNGTIAVNVWDTRKDQFYNAATNLTEVTANATKPFPEEFTQGYGFFHHSGNEYWMLCSPEGIGNPTDATTSVKIVRMNLTFPADLAKAEPGSIKVEVLGVSQELKGSVLHAKLADGQGTVYGMTKGREVSPGKFRLYFGDSEGNIITATPQ